MGDWEIEVEYQVDTIGIYGLDFDGTDFILTPKHTACLAGEACSVPDVKGNDLENKVEGNSCAPGSGCC